MSESNFHIHDNCDLFLFYFDSMSFLGFLGGSDGKESTCNAGDLRAICGSGDPLEQGMANHSSILAWRIPWTEEAGGL